MKLRTLGDAARDNRRNRRREGQQEEEADERVAVVLGEYAGAGEELHAVGDRIADEEIGDRRDREVDEDLHERVDLVLFADGAQFEEREARVHREDHGRAKQQEEGVGAGF